MTVIMHSRRHEFEVAPNYVYTEAQYHGRCGSCGHTIHQGSVIRLDVTDSDASWEHAAPECPDQPDNPDLSAITVPKDTPLCERCFTYHRGECL